MDCDRVFVALTSGPFPTGRADDSLVERHLMTCVACRQFAAALQPCTARQTHESLPVAERQALPCYHGARQPVAKQPVASMAAVLQGPAAVGPRPAWPLGVSSGWRNELTVSMHGPQIAAFGLAQRHRPRRRSMTAPVVFFLALLCLGCWVFGLIRI
ncbi:hypothetical protein Pla108_02280 [Botrimarina colliarenosi]|uniref:Zinc-finger domain-containing protein n=1 Tax=Botrimarina colliarenosi TaxID=2528001 RepID=A0A5C6AM93_9BACT|nr:hypothetical protein [Botrimarina colliarenosi]TWT99293.1 hypothetical protein Pla108_02280 [Botrimarina colliarenosi]